MGWDEINMRLSRTYSWKAGESLVLLLVIAYKFCRNEANIYYWENDYGNNDRNKLGWNRDAPF